MRIEMFDIPVRFGIFPPACGKSAMSLGLTRPSVWEGSEMH